MSIDLDDIESRIAAGIYGDDRLSKEERNDAFSALAEVIAEVERLRSTNELLEQEARIRKNLCDGLAEEVAYLRACVPPVHPGDYGHEAWIEGGRAEVQAERAAVVAWLRAEAAGVSDTRSDLRWNIRGLSNCIERGEHRREEKP